MEATRFEMSKLIQVQVVIESKVLGIRLQQRGENKAKSVLLVFIYTVQLSLSLHYPLINNSFHMLLYLARSGFIVVFQDQLLAI